MYNTTQVLNFITQDKQTSGVVRENVCVCVLARVCVFELYILPTNFLMFTLVYNEAYACPLLVPTL